MSSQFSTVCIDLDNTIIPWKPIWSNPKPFPGVRDAMKELERQGYYIYILTSRLSDKWCEESYEVQGYSSPEDFKLDQKEHIVQMLLGWGIPFNEVGAEKIPAMMYADDLAVQINEEYPLPAAIYDFIEENRG